MIFSAFISSIFFFLFFVADGLLCIDLQCVGTRGEVVVIMYSLSMERFCDIADMGMK